MNLIKLNFMETEVCDVKEILGRRFDSKGRVEYLVSWMQYPVCGDTWEGLENLFNVQDKLDEYDQRVKRELENQRRLFDELKKKEREELKRKLKERYGSWEKGDVIHRVVGVKKNKVTGMYDCVCEWEARNADNTDFPLSSLVPLQSIRNRHPEVLIEFYEHTIEMYGRHEQCYPKYFPDKVKQNEEVVRQEDTQEQTRIGTGDEDAEEEAPQRERRRSSRHKKTKKIKKSHW